MNTTAIQDLMVRRIRRILLVCNNYDKFALEEDGRIEEQIALFSRCADFLIEGLEKRPEYEGHRPMKHILNSAGTERFTEYQFDMCRL